MGDWQELGQAVFIGLTFAFLVAKLISIVVSFRGDQLRITREDDLQGEADASRNGDSGVLEEDAGVSEEEKLLGEESDDDWEGIESTELDEEFSAATTFVAATAADRMAPKVSNDVQLQLYGLYKIATEGPCNAPQPSAMKVTARAKWNAWQKLGVMSPEEAMQKYIMIVTELYPNWADNSNTRNKDEDTAASVSSSSDKARMGPVFSSFVYEEELDNDLTLEAIHVSAREGKTQELLSYIENGVSVNLRDSEGRTPLHWAVDRGHFDSVETLIGKNADINAKDEEGQTPLHYAVVCGREAIAEFLVKHNADINIRDKDDNSPRSLCSSPWPFMHSTKVLQ
ncbi:hypothetical protein J5N97_028948 [Dioscorea zingiberensis]|uniref:ACB domain-containing protein n=1 Tax=Dioscorea zingiberensis TaxID=325984 RepID=A0A9D5H587_9LILI|nr:hypothetical protein J5N97_028948 [Dioscorea zingiberensis]